MQCLTHHTRCVWLTDTLADCCWLVVLSGWLCRWFIAAGKRPVPFRTRKLSLRRADGTALGRVWESRLLPTLNNFMFGGWVVTILFVVHNPPSTCIFQVFSRLLYARAVTKCVQPFYPRTGTIRAYVANDCSYALHRAVISSVYARLSASFTPSLEPVWVSH